VTIGAIELSHPLVAQNIRLLWAVGLDSVRTEGCSEIYQSLEHTCLFVWYKIDGGWLGFTATVQLDKADYDSEAERARVKRDNLGIHFGDHA
jgi:hypothetical protein